MATETLVYVGTYNKPPDDGIFAYRLDPDSGDLQPLSSAGGIENPSFVTIDPAGRYLCAVAEVGEFEGQPGGGVASYAIDPASGALSPISTQSSVGPGPCHVSIDATGRYALVANYGGGSVAVLPLGSDGALAKASAFVQHAGSGSDEQRQKAPHAHSINPSPDNRFAFVPDLGLDRVLTYELNHDTGALEPTPQPWVEVAAGHGPRHLAFRPDGRYAYVINEMGNTITAFSFEPATGGLTVIQDISTLPPGYSETSYTADIHFHPSGRFLYGSNRGHDSIAIFAVDETSGHLEMLGLESVRGTNPRNFALDPTGSFLYAANGQTDNIVAFRIDQDTGQLQATGHVTEVVKPVCIAMLAR